MELDAEYWRKRWENQDTPWHEKTPDVTLVKYFSEVKPTCVLVPLCGKCVDMAWMASRGHEVIGVELSPLACEAFFQEQGIPYEKRQSGPFVRYSSLEPAARITLLCGDIFQLSEKDLASPLPFGALYDRAALIALPPDLRKRYSALLTRLIKALPRSNPPFFFLQFVLERKPHDTEGPPHSVRESDVREYYEKDFTIELLEREDAELIFPHRVNTDQCVYRLTPR